MSPDTPADGEALASSESVFMDAVWDALKADANDLRKQQRILRAFRAALIPRPAEPAQAAQDEGPQNRKLKTCKGCKHFVSEYWREPSGDGETYDSGTSADCTKAGRSISTYSGDEPAPPSWCPFLIAAAQEGRE